MAQKAAPAELMLVGLHLRVRVRLQLVVNKYPCWSTFLIYIFL